MPDVVRISAEIYVLIERAFRSQLIVKYVKVDACLPASEVKERIF